MSTAPSTAAPGSWVTFARGTVPRELGAVVGKVVGVRTLGEHLAAKAYETAVRADQLPTGITLETPVVSVHAVTRELPAGFTFPLVAGVVEAPAFVPEVN
jgi:hypothetical protein